MIKEPGVVINQGDHLVSLNYNKEILVFDDLDLIYETQQMYDIVTLNDFSWYINARTVLKSDTYDTALFNDFDFMNHVFIVNKNKNSDSAYLPIKMLELFSDKSGIKFKHILRAQANLTPEKKITKPSPPHTDIDIPHYVLLLYLNDSDGDTIMFDDNRVEFKRIAPKCGRFVLFDGSIKHSLIPPTNTKHRIVFNYNLGI